MKPIVYSIAHPTIFTRLHTHSSWLSMSVSWVVNMDSSPWRTLKLCWRSVLATFATASALKASWRGIELSGMRDMRRNEELL